ncbi:MAG: hypothetical protein GY703_00180 [Gammaproteobacteria bacterium]|nr:hypothetical protein [Gammaproteobacteria bacterium]
MERSDRLNQAMDACAQRLDSLNKLFPDLATSVSSNAVEDWKNKSKQTEVRSKPSGGVIPKKQASPYPVKKIRKRALELLQANGLDEVLESVQEEFGLTLNMPKLIHLIGNTAYRAALRKDAKLMLDNAVNYEQIASLWNDLERPAFGSPNWNSQSVSVLVGSGG